MCWMDGYPETKCWGYSDFDYPSNYDLEYHAEKSCRYCCYRNVATYCCHNRCYRNFHCNHALIFGQNEVIVDMFAVRNCLIFYNLTMVTDSHDLECPGNEHEVTVNVRDDSCLPLKFEDCRISVPICEQHLPWFCHQILPVMFPQ